MVITGGCGFIGHHLVKSLLQKPDYNIIIIDNMSNAVTEFTNHDRIALYKEDIRNKETISDIFKREKVDCCIHLAAKASVRVGEPDLMSVNIDGTLSILNACKENGVRNFVFASSAAVYGEAKALPIREGHPLKPISQYGVSKMDAEKLVVSFLEKGKIQNVVCLRLFNVYGEGHNNAYAGVITKFAERLRNGLAPVIYGDGLQTRDFVSVKDVVNAIMISITLENISGIFNIGTGRSITIAELARQMTRMAGLDAGPLYEQQNLSNEIKNSEADISKASKVLKFQPKDTLSKELSRLLQRNHLPNATK